MTLDRNANGGVGGEESCDQPNGSYKCLGDIPYPSNWNDAKRIEVLYAQFRQRDVNPENYDSKMKIWQDMIELYCLHRGTAIFSCAALQMAFARGGNQMPYCLDTVIEDLSNNKKIRLYAEYEYDPLNGWKTWAMNGLIWRPLSWGVNKLKSSIGRYQQEKIEYVHLAVLQKFCEKLQNKVLPAADGKLIHYGMFKQLSDAVHVHMQEKTLYLALITLMCQQKLGLEFKQENNERVIHLIKIPALNEPSKTLEITEMDRATHQLQMTQAQLQEQLEDLETEISTLDAKVRQLVNENKRTVAKSYLRKKHLLEKNHHKRTLALQNIEELINGVAEAQSHGQILDAYRLGSNALQQVLKTSGLTYDKVDEVVADVRESLDAHHDIEDALATAGNTQRLLEGDSGERELELELRDIISEERLQKAPDVPLHTPGASISPINAATASTPRSFTNVVNIKDEDLLAMIDQLELEERTPPRSSQNNNNNSRVFS